MQFRHNSYPGKCPKCDAYVGAGQGVLFSRLGGRWGVGCIPCYPELTGWKSDEHAKFQREALEEARRELLAKKETERLNAIRKAAILWEVPFAEQYRQEAWQDVTTWKVAYLGEASDAEIKLAASCPASGSLSSSLRAYGGRSVTHIDRKAKTITLCESVQLYD